MYPQVKEIVDKAKAALLDAQNAESTSATVFYGDNAILILLSAMLNEAWDTNERLMRIEKLLEKQNAPGT